MTTREKTAEAYFQEAIDWDTKQRQQDVKAKKLAIAVAWTCGIVAGLAVLSTTALLPLKTLVPVVIRVNNETGAYDVSDPGEGLAIGQDRNKKIVIADAGKYVTAREGFTRGEAESNYRLVYFMSCGQVRSEWDTWFNPETNPNSPVRTMATTDSERVDIQNYTFLPTDLDDIRVLQIRFDKTVMKGVAPPVKTRYISTMTIKYDRTNVPGLQKDLHINPFGFCVVNYRRDQEGTSQVLQAAPPQDRPGALSQGSSTPAAASQAVTPATIGLPPEGAPR